MKPTQIQVHFISLLVVSCLCCVQVCVLEGEELGQKIKFCFPCLDNQLSILVILLKEFDHVLSQSPDTVVDHYFGVFILGGGSGNTFNRKKAFGGTNWGKGNYGWFFNNATNISSGWTIHNLFTKSHKLFHSPGRQWFCKTQTLS